jgi:hypothetical protein
VDDSLYGARLVSVFSHCSFERWVAGSKANE